jgi:predicted HicB family RNase H-like nuclease
MKKLKKKPIGGIIHCMKTVKLTIRIPEELHARAIKLAYRPLVRVSLNKFIESAIHKYIKTKEKP